MRTVGALRGGFSQSVITFHACVTSTLTKRQDATPRVPQRPPPGTALMADTLQIPHYRWALLALDDVLYLQVRRLGKSRGRWNSHAFRPDCQFLTAFWKTEIRC